VAVVTNVGHTAPLEAAVELRLSECTDVSESVLCLCILIDLKLIEAIRLLEITDGHTVKEMQEMHSLKLRRQECALVASRVYGGELPLDCAEFTTETLRAYGLSESLLDGLYGASEENNV
jgi:hypothetical protein